MSYESGTSGAPEYELTGLLYSVAAPVKYGLGRIKQQLIILTETPSPQMIPIEVHDALLEKCRLLPLRTRVRVRFALEGRLWHPPQGAPKPILRLVALEITPIPD
ncbi:MAG: hypothetical protein ABDH66_05620 [Bacteroidia bacterium]